jgi:hypothetical protein
MGGGANLDHREVRRGNPAQDRGEPNGVPAPQQRDSNLIEGGGADGGRQGNNPARREDDICRDRAGRHQDVASREGHGFGPLHRERERGFEAFEKRVHPDSVTWKCWRVLSGGPPLSCGAAGEVQARGDA